LIIWKKNWLIIKPNIPLNNKYICDTMALILRLEKRKLPQTVKEIFQKAEGDECEILIPSLVFAEIAYLSEKERISVTLETVKAYLDQNNSINEQELSLEIISSSFKINDIFELHDRLIAGTAYHLKSPLITNDPVIQNSTFVNTVWYK